MKKASCAILALSLFAASCASGGSAYAMSSFYEIPIGSTEDEVIATVGKPYSIKQCQDGSVEYLYIERIKAGYRNLEERRYVIILKEGKVVSKELKQSSPPAYQFDSYEMQTTQKDI